MQPLPGSSPDAPHASDSTEPGGRRPLGGELVIPVATAIFAVYYLYTIWGLSWQAAAAGIGIISAMAVLLVILALRFWREWQEGKADFSPGELVYPLPSFGHRGALLALSLGFIYAMNFLGFTISLFLFLVSAMLVLAGTKHLRKGVPLALAVSLGGYLLFIVLIRARFPHGPFEQFAGSLF